MTDFHVERIYYRDLAETEGGRAGWRYTVDEGDTLDAVDRATFRAWLAKQGVSERDLKWESASGMDIAGIEYTDFTAKREPPMKVTWSQARRDDPMFGAVHIVFPYNAK